MGQVIVRQLDDAVIETHRGRAKARGVSLEQELRDVLTQAARLRREELVRRADEIRAMTPEPPPGARNWTAEELIREGRDSR
jgi:plasmid stability protein